MKLKTNFSFELQFSATSNASQPQRQAVMDSLQTSLQTAFAAGDPAATVLVSRSRKGGYNRIAELVTTLQDAGITNILEAFSAQHGLTITALE